LVLIHGALCGLKRKHIAAVQHEHGRRDGLSGGWSGRAGRLGSGQRCGRRSGNASRAGLLVARALLAEGARCVVEVGVKGHRVAVLHATST
jgi:hypothetical protein